MLDAEMGEAWDVWLRPPSPSLRSDADDWFWATTVTVCDRPPVLALAIECMMMNLTEDLLLDCPEADCLSDTDRLVGEAFPSRGISKESSTLRRFGERSW